MAVDKYTYVKDIRARGEGSVVPYNIGAGSPTDLAMGEFVEWDGTNRQLLRLATWSFKFVGITAFSQLRMASLGNQAALASRNQPFAVWTSGIHKVTGTVGETYSHGDAVYMTAAGGTQAVTKSAGTGGVQVGIAWLPDGTQVVGAVDVPILIDEYCITQV